MERTPTLFDKQVQVTRKTYKPPRSPLKWHGGKHYDADWIVDRMPPHLVYVEPFFGSGKVLFSRDPSRDWFHGHPQADCQDSGKLFARHQGCSEIANDVYGELMNFWDVIRDPGTVPGVFEASRFNAVLASYVRAKQASRWLRCRARRQVFRSQPPVSARVGQIVRHHGA